MRISRHDQGRPVTLDEGPHNDHLLDENVLLRQQVDDFARAVSAIADRRPEWHGGVGRWSESVYDRVRGAVLGRGASVGRSVASSRLPGRLGHLDWLVTVDKSVAEMSQLPGPTPARLADLRSRRWSVEDGPQLATWSTMIGRWVTEAARLLGEGELHVYLRGHRCPGCSADHAQVGRNGERRRVPALLATDAGVTCQECGLAYPPDKWGLLAAVLASESVSVS